MSGRAGDGGQRGRDRMRRVMMLLVAGVWLALAGLALSGAAQAASAAPFTALATNTSPPIATTTTPTTIPTNTPTSTPTTTPTSSATPSATATKTATATSTATSAPTAVPPIATNPGDVGPQPTKVVSQLPSADNGSSGPLGGLTPGAFGSNGLLLATTSSCIVALLGLLIAAIALVVLLRGGYGPFLNALLRGKRAGQKRGKRAAKGDLAAAGANTSSNHYGFGSERDAHSARRSDPSWSGDDDGRRQGSRSRSSSRSRSRGSGQNGW